MTKWGESGGTWVKARDLVLPGKTEAEFRAAVVEKGTLQGKEFVLKGVRPATVSGRSAYVFETTDGRLFSVNREGTTIGAQIVRSGLPPAGDYRLDATANAGSPTGYALALKAL